MTIGNYPESLSQVGRFLVGRLGIWASSVKLGASFIKRVRLLKLEKAQLGCPTKMSERFTRRCFDV